MFLGIREVFKAPGSFKNNRRSNDVAATSLGASSIQAPLQKVSSHLSVPFQVFSTAGACARLSYHPHLIPRVAMQQNVTVVIGSVPSNTYKPPGCQ